MSKYLYFQDLHLSGKNPINRIDKYLGSIFLKLKEIISIAKSNKCDCIVSGGDNLDSPIISLPICDKFIDIIEEGKVPFYTVWGNHDEQFHSSELSNSTTLQHMFNRSSLINCLDVIENDKVYIKSFHYFHDCESKIKEEGLLHDKKDKLTIAIVHALITEKPLPHSAMHVYYKNIKTNYDYILVAHNHHPFEFKLKDTTILDIGCIGRRKIDEQDIQPSVLLIDTETKELKIIKLKSAKEGKDVFDLEKVMKAKKFEHNIDNFIDSLNSVKLQSLNIKDKVEQIGKESKIDREIIDAVINRIGEMENEKNKS